MDRTVASYDSSIANPFDIILVEQYMPVIDGADAVKAVRESGYTGLIIGLTNNVSAANVNYFKSFGVNYVVGKPLRMRELQKILHMYVDFNSGEYFLTVKCNCGSHLLMDLCLYHVECHQQNLRTPKGVRRAPTLHIDAVLSVMIALTLTLIKVGVQVLTQL